MRHPLRITVLLACAWLAAPATLAATAAAPAPRVPPQFAAPPALTLAHEMALRLVLERLLVVEMASTRLNRPGDPQYAELQGAFAREATPEMLLALLVPIYAQYINEPQAQELMNAANWAGVRKMMRHQANLAAGIGAKAPSYSPAEQQEVMRALKLPSFVLLTKALPRIQADVERALGAAREAHLKQVNTQMFSALLNGLQAQETMGAAADSEPPSFEKSGISYFDELLAIMLGAHAKLVGTHARFEASLDKRGQHDILRPANLSNRAAIERGKAILAVTDTELEAYLAELGAINQQRSAALERIEMPGKAQTLEQLESMGRKNYTFLLKLGEGMREILEVQRRVLVFAEAKIARINLHDGHLMFDNDEDSRRFNALRAELVDALSALQQVVNDQQTYEAGLQTKAAATLNMKLPAPPAP